MSALWLITRVFSSAYLFSWSMVTTVARHVLAPRWHWRGTTCIPAVAFGASTDGISGNVVAVLVFNMLLYPCAAMFLVQHRAERLLDPLQYESATVAVLTAGYCPQLTPAQAMAALVSTGSSHGRILSGQSKQGQLAHKLAMAAAKQTSEAMSSRLGQLSQYLLSYAFAIVKQLQLGIVLCALWLTHDQVTRAVATICTLSVVALLTALLKPYKVPQLNRLDVACNLIVIAHVLILLAVPPDTRGLLWGLFALHATVSSRLLWHAGWGRLDGCDSAPFALPLR